MTRPEDRPDPLADPFEAQRERAWGSPPPGPDLSVCSQLRGEAHCGTPPSVIIWMGCTRGEHAGPMAFCTAHAAPVAGWPLHCAQCGGPVRVLMITSMDGTTVVALDPPQPPPDLWRAVAPEPPPSP